MKLIAYQKGDRRIMARVLDNKALPFADLEEFWTDPQRNLLAAAEVRSGGEPIAKLVQVPPLPDTARVLCAGLNYLAHAQEAHFTVPEQPDIFARWLLNFSFEVSDVTTDHVLPPSLVPASAVPSYAGASSYLLMVKYNNYAGAGTGDGVNRLAIANILPQRSCATLSSAP